MIRLSITAEGLTEQRFASRVLAPFLGQRGVAVANPIAVGHARKRGRIHRGGLTAYAPFRNDLKNRLKQDKSEEARFTTMLDLYALPRDFPGYRDAASLVDKRDRVARLEESLEQDIGDRRFIAYIQLHEFEALLLADPAKLECYYVGYGKEVSRIVEMCSRFQSPEEIDDGEHTCPSRRIAREIPQYLREKPLAAIRVAERIGLEQIRAKCPHFHEWLSKLERLGSA